MSRRKSHGTAKVKDEEEEGEVLYELDEKEMIQANKVFDLNCPSNGKEMLDSDQLKTAMRAMGFEPRADEIKSLLKKFANKSGKVNRAGFHKIMSHKIGSTPGFSDTTSKDQISRVFDLLDLDKTGKITLDNLRSISKELNEDITDEELQEMIEEADKDGDKQIDKDEFHDIMKKTSLY